MKTISMRLPDPLHAQVAAKVKAEARTISAVVVRLLEKWVAGEVDLTPPAPPKTGIGQT
jgi:hypothetical protein